MPTITKDNWQKIKADVAFLLSHSVYVGIPMEETERDFTEDDSGPITNAEIGYIQELGSPARNIPARPFLRPGVWRNENEIVRRLKKAANFTFMGRRGEVTKQYNAIGLVAQHGAKNIIREGIEPPLAEYTLQKRRERGRTGEKPLYDTGQLVNSIDYVIRRSDRYKNANSKRK